jgi:dihydroorotase
MSAFMAMGLPIEQILAMTTVNPGRVLGREPHLGTLALGAPADIVLLNIDAGSGGSRIDPLLTLRSGVPLRSA